MKIAQQIAVPPEPPINTNQIALQAAASSSVTLFLVALVSTISKNFLQPWGERHALRISSSQSQDQTIKRELLTLIATTNCDRALVVEFTNGEISAANTPISKCVVTAEETKRGVTSVANLLSTRTLAFGNLIKKTLIEQPFRKVCNADTTDIATKGLYKEIAADFTIDYFLRNADNPLGFISLHFREAFKEDFELVIESTLSSSADIIISNMLRRTTFWNHLINKI